MKFAYARVSTKDQNLDLQLDALSKHGYDEIFIEKLSGTIKERPELNRLLARIRKNDSVVVWSLDRLGRNVPHLIELMELFKQHNVELFSLKESIDTSTAMGKFIYHFYAAMAEYIANWTKEKTMAGLEAARARGKSGGRKKGLSIEAENSARAAETLYKEGNFTVDQILKRLNISKPTLYRYLRHRNVTINNYKKYNTASVEDEN